MTTGEETNLPDSPFVDPYQLPFTHRVVRGGDEADVIDVISVRDGSTQMQESLVFTQASIFVIHGSGARELLANYRDIRAFRTATEFGTRAWGRAFTLQLLTGEGMRSFGQLNQRDYANVLAILQAKGLPATSWMKMWRQGRRSRSVD